MIYIIEITKQECFELRKIGYTFGNRGLLQRSYSRSPKYYLTETEKALADLETIRTSNVIFSNLNN